MGEHLTIDSVPASITRKQLVDWFAAIGIDAAGVPRDAVIQLSPDAITIDVYAHGLNGERRILNATGDAAARHKVCIPIEDEQ